MSGSFFVDAMVVGGGPAGAMVALRLARLGWTVALAERAPRHRDKTCGQCLSPRVAPLLHQAGVLDDVTRLAAGRLRRFCLHLAGLPAMEVPIAAMGAPIGAARSAMDASGPQAVGWLIRRADLDQMLMDRAAQAGAVVFQPAAARIIEHRRDDCVIELQHGGNVQRVAAAMVIGADGLRSRTAAALGLHGRARSGRKYGFSLDLPLAGAWDADAVSMFVHRNGYLGVIRQGGALHLAGLVQSRRASAGANRGEIDGGADRAASRDPRRFGRTLAAAFERLRSAGLDQLEGVHLRNLVAAGPMPCRPDHVANLRGALVGDAAGYVEPFTGEGMAWAMESAGLLADVIAAAPGRRWSQRCAAAYQHRWRQRIAVRHRACHWLALALERPGAASLAARLARWRPGWTQRVVHHLVTA